MSSAVPRSKRIKRPARTRLVDFADEECAAITAAQANFGKPVVVFGSRARGDWADDSDIDIGVQGYNARHHKPIADLISDYSGIRVDLFKIEHARTHNSAVEI